MNYRHIFHAGSFTDVVKHIILIMLIEKMKEKPKPFTVLDAFAGVGIYDLKSEEANKTMEHKTGIELLQKRKLVNVPSAIQTYLKINEQIGQNLYPGSPYIVSTLIRPADQLIACELHKEDYLKLKENIWSNVHNIDAYNAIKAFLPPQTSRGLVVLDPAFEVKDEFNKLIEGLKVLKKRFLGGVVMIWYPIKDKSSVSKFYQELKEVGYSEYITVEFETKLGTKGLNKCGIVIANPPQIKEELKLIMQFLCDVVYNSEAKYLVK